MTGHSSWPEIDPLRPLSAAARRRHVGTVFPERGAAGQEAVVFSWGEGDRWRVYAFFSSRHFSQGLMGVKS